MAFLLAEALTSTLLELVLVLALSAAVGLAFLRLRMPPVVGYLAAGALIGPHGFGLVYEPELVDQLAEVGVVVLLFTVGMELSIAEVARMRRSVLVAGGLQLAGTILLGAGIAALSGMPFGQSVFLGYLLSLSSTAAITRLLADRGEFGSPPGRVALSICIAQDLAVVPMVLSLPLLGSAEGEEVGVGATLVDLLLSLLSFAAVAAVAWLVVPRVLDQIARSRSREIFVLGVLVICLAVATATALLGMSLALGAFLAGVVIGSSQHHHQATSEIEPMRDALSSLFFFSIGMLFEISAVVEHPFLVIGALGVVVLGKAGIAYVAVRVFGQPWWSAARAALMVAQVGEFSFVIAQVAAGRDLVDPGVQRLFLVVAVASIAATPVLFQLGKRLAGARAEAGRIETGVRDHVVIVGYGPAGQNLAKSLGELGLQFVVIELNAETVRAARNRGIRIVQGDATRPSVLRAAGLQHARLLVIATNVPEATKRLVALIRQHLPKLHILARANYLSEVPGLEALGVDEIVPQELETSVEITARTLRHYLVPDDEVERLVDEIRERAYGLRRMAPGRAGRGVDLEGPIKGLKVATFRVEVGSQLVGTSLADSELRKKTGLSVVAIERGGEQVLGIGPETVLDAGDSVVGIGSADAVRESATWFRGPDPLGALERSES